MSRIPRDAIRELIAKLTVTDWSPDGWSVAWQVEHLSFEGLRNDSVGAWIELGINSYRSAGVDDYRQQFNPSTQSNQSVLYGLRRFTLTLDARSYSIEVPAWDVLEAIRLRLNNPGSVTVKQALAQHGLSWIRTHPTVSLNYSEKGDVDNRMIWRSTMDVEFSWLSYAQVTDDPGSVIETVGDVENDSPDGTNLVTGTLLNPDGTPVPGG